MSTIAFDPNAAARADSGVFGLPHSAEEAGVLLIPVPWDATTSYRAGTSRGPRAILEASRQVDLFDLELKRPYESGIHMLPESETIVAWNTVAREAALPIIEAGGVADGSEAFDDALSEVNELGERLNAWVEAETEKWLAKGKVVGVVGGDHSVAFGSIRAVARRHPGMGVLHIDAHADLREAYEGFVWSHASVMYNVLRRQREVARLVQVGIRDFGEDEFDHITASNGRVVTFFDAELAGRRFMGEKWAESCARIIEGLPHEVYVSFDIDGLEPASCPHTGTPVPGGLSFNEASYLLKALAVSGRKIVGFDLNEVAPGPPGDEWDANVGARLLYRLIGWTLRSRA